MKSTNSDIVPESVGISEEIVVKRPTRMNFLFPFSDKSNMTKLETNSLSDNMSKPNTSVPARMSFISPVINLSTRSWNTISSFFKSDNVSSDIVVTSESNNTSRNSNPLLSWPIKTIDAVGSFFANNRSSVNQNTTITKVDNSSGISWFEPIKGTTETVITFVTSIFRRDANGNETSENLSNRTVMSKELPRLQTLPRLVIGAENDFIVDQEGVIETAKYMGVDPVIALDVYHDVMLGPKWEKTAVILNDWLETL